MNSDLLITPEQFCNKFNACSEGKVFALQFPTMKEVWGKCENPRWMLWICSQLRLDLDPKALRLFACYCVRYTPLSNGKKVWSLLKDERSKNAVRLAEKFANGKATIEELLEAKNAAVAAAAKSRPAYAAYAAAYAAAAYTYTYAYAYYTRIKAQQFQARKLHKVIANPFIV
jgi:hypothetical protein